MSTNTQPLPPNDGERLFDEFEALNDRVAQAIAQAPWLALRPSDFDTVVLAKRYLHLGAVLLELLKRP